MSFAERYGCALLVYNHHLREVLEDDSGGLEGDLDVLGCIGNPVENLLNVSGKYVKLIAISDSGLKQDTD